MNEIFCALARYLQLFLRDRDIPQPPGTATINFYDTQDITEFRVYTSPPPFLS